MFSPATLVILTVLAVICVYTVLNYRKKLRSGCCGGSGDQVQQTVKPDHDPSHYPHCAAASVEGMMCHNCARRIENTLNAENDLLATVDLNKKQLTVRGKGSIDEARIRQLVARAGYRVTAFSK